MKDLTKIYIDLSKLSEEELRIVRMTLYKNREYVPFFTNLFEIDRYYKLHCDKGDWLCGNVMFNEKTEILFPEFIKMFEGGEEEKEIENIKDIAHTEGVLVGLKICKELWAQGTISHETIQEEIYHYQEELDNLNSK